MFLFLFHQHGSRSVMSKPRRSVATSKRYSARKGSFIQRTSNVASSAAYFHLKMDALAILLADKSSALSARSDVTARTTKCDIGVTNRLDSRGSVSTNQCPFRIKSLARDSPSAPSANRRSTHTNGSINRRAFADLDVSVEMSVPSSITARDRRTGSSNSYPRCVPLHWERPSLFAIDGYLLDSKRGRTSRTQRTRGNRPFGTRRKPRNHRAAITAE